MAPLRARHAEHGEAAVDDLGGDGLEVQRPVSEDDGGDALGMGNSPDVRLRGSEGERRFVSAGGQISRAYLSRQLSAAELSRQNANGRGFATRGVAARTRLGTSARAPRACGESRLARARSARAPFERKFARRHAPGRMSMSERDLASFLRLTRSGTSVARKPIPAGARASSRAAGLATMPVATAERIERADMFTRGCRRASAGNMARETGHTPS